MQFSQNIFYCLSSSSDFPQIFSHIFSSLFSSCSPSRPFAVLAVLLFQFISFPGLLQVSTEGMEGEREQGREREQEREREREIFRGEKRGRGEKVGRREGGKERKMSLVPSRLIRTLSRLPLFNGVSDVYSLPHYLPH